MQEETTYSSNLYSNEDTGKVCPICDKELSPTTNLSFHMMLHPSEKHFACDFCLFTFATKEDVRTHVKKDHVLEKPMHTCQECGKVFSNGTNLNRHTYLRHSDATKYTCIFCDRQFKEFGQYRIHESSHDRETSFRCETCSVYFSSQKGLELHKSVGDCGIKVLTCCDVMFTSRLDYVKHTLAMHKKYKKASQKCKYCGKCFPYAFRKREHERECGYGPVDPNQKRVDKKGKPRDHKCQQCNSAFTTLQGLSLHARTHLEGVVTPSLTCPICNKKLSSRSALWIHKKRHFVSERFFCEVCKRGFFSRASLKSHEVVHTKEKPFKCKFCDRAFPYKQSLAAHERSHTGERPYKCRYCEMRFSQNFVKRCHERIHTGERPFTCQICSKSFIQQSTLSQHVRTHKTDRECNICGCQFSARKEHKEHMRSHLRDAMAASEIVEEVVNSENQATTVATDVDGNVYMFYELQ